MKTFEINSFDTVRDFLFEMYYRSESKFDPAEDVTALKDRKGLPLYTETESAYLNKVMMECFIFCIFNDLNIYTVATMAQYDVRQVKASA